MLKDSEKRALGSQNFQKIENNFFNQITGDIIDHNDSSTLTYFTPKNFSINQEFPIEYYNNSYFKNRDYSLLADYNNVFSNNSNYHLLSTGIKNDVDYLASIDYFQY